VDFGLAGAVSLFSTRVSASGGDNTLLAGKERQPGPGDGKCRAVAPTVVSWCPL